MDRRHFLRTTASVGFVVVVDGVVVACGDDGPNAGPSGSTTTPPRTDPSTTAAPPTTGTPPPSDVTTSEVTTTTDRRRDTTRYGPLATTPDANGLLLPAGFTSELLAAGGQPVSYTHLRAHETNNSI